MSVFIISNVVWLRLLQLAMFKSFHIEVTHYFLSAD